MSSEKTTAPLRAARPSWPRRSLAVLIGASLLPILGLGVCLRPAWQWQSTERELETLRNRVAHADGRAFRHDTQQCQVMLEAASLLQREFLALLPVGFDRVDLFSQVREFASRAGISLQTLQLGSDKALRLGQDGLDVARLELQLRGSGPLDSIGRLLEQLEAAQLPAGLDQLTLAARTDGGFDILLEIGLFHWTSASAAPQDAQQP
jgi:hypothetical protein